MLNVAYFEKILADLLSNCSSTQTFWIAYSGGVDSHVLLHLMAQYQQQAGIKPVIRAIHVNHQLQPMASSWAAHCQQTCDALQIPLVCVTVSVTRRRGESLEACAREARYQIFHEQISPRDILLTAHHQNDLAETFLLHALRGSGIQGLAAIPKISQRQHYYLLRPLLDFSRDEIEHYAKRENLKWVEDGSNQETHFDRNFLRRKIFPILQERWPQYAKAFTRSAEHAKKYANRLKKQMTERLPQISGSRPDTLSIQRLNTLNSEEQADVIRAWLQHQQVPLPSQKQLAEIQHTILHSSIDAAPEVKWKEVIVRRYRDDVFVFRQMMDAICLAKEMVLSWPLEKIHFKLPETIGILTQEKVVGKGIALRKLNQPIQIRFRSPNPRIKKKFQALGIPPWERWHWPLLYQAEQLIAIPPLWVDKNYRAQPDEPGIVIHYSKGVNTWKS